ncbi:PTS beta-glucoside transporter subunit IIBCA, partial [Enterococcus faecium]
GGLGGLFAGLTSVKAYSVAWGLFGLPAYLGEGDFMNFWFMLAAVVFSFAGSAVSALILGVPAQEVDQETNNQKISEKRKDKNL